jgi:pimeloyl-ACP methyl ester carboxylesterase
MAGRIILRKPLPLLEAIFTLRTNPVIKTPKLAHWLLFSPDFPEETLMKYYPKMESESFRAFLDLLGLNLAHPKRVKAPLLVLGAENDWAIGPDTRATARAYGVQEEILPSVGHYMILEANWRYAADRILSWLKEKGI